MKTVKNLIVRAEKEWRLPHFIAAWLFWGPLAMSLLLFLFSANGLLYRLLLLKDGPVVWLRLIALIVAAVAGLGVLLRASLNRRFRLAGFFFAFTAVSLFFVIQPTLRGSGSDVIVLSIIANLAMLILSLWGTIAYVVDKRLRMERYWYHSGSMLMPPFFLASSFFITFAYKLTGLLSGTWPVQRYTVWAEFCFALALSLFAILTFRRLHQQLAMARNRAIITPETY